LQSDVIGAPAGIRTRVHGSRGLEAVATNVRCRLEWASMRSGFMDYMRSQDYSAGYSADLTSYLDRYVTTITGPEDVISIFSRVKAGKRHLWLAFRVWFNYLEALGFDNNILSVLRKSLPKGANTTNPDLKVPDVKAVQKSLSSLDEAPQRYKALYDLLIDSGLRLIEAIDVINNFKADEVERVERFYRVEVGAFRGSKQAFFGYFTAHTFKMLAAGGFETLSYYPASRFYGKHGVVRPKYIRDLLLIP
jgi:intergrase/recombinase